VLQPTSPYLAPDSLWRQQERHCWKRRMSRTPLGPGGAIGAPARASQVFAGDGFRQEEGAIRHDSRVISPKPAAVELALVVAGAGLGEVELVRPRLRSRSPER